jgi:colanic acid/amylovoran biosynthesis protein
MSTAGTATDRRGGVGGEPAAEVRLINLHTRQNLGDAAITSGAAKLIRDHWPGVRLTAASRYVNDRDWLRSVGIERVGPAISFPAPGQAPTPIRALVFGASAARHRLRRSSRVDPPAPDLALSGGGGYLFSRRQPELTFRHLLLEIETMAERCPTVLLPQTVGPLTRDKDVKSVRRALRDTRHLFVRDRTSLDVALDQLELDPEKVSFAPDLVFALAREGRAAPAATGDPRVAMTVLDWRWAGGTSEAYAAYLDAMAAVAQGLIDDGCRLDLCVQVDMRGKRGHDDMAVAEEVRSRLPHPERVEVISAGASAEQAIERYASYDLVIGSRLHSALMGLCGGTPSVAVAYQPKTDSIYHDLELGDWVLEARGLDPVALRGVATSILEDQQGSANRAMTATGRIKDQLYSCLSGPLESLLGPPVRREPG